MVTHGERQLLHEAIHQCRPVAVEEPHEADFTFLRMALGEGEGLGALELTAQRIVAPLGCLDDLVMQRLHFVLHLAERGFHRALERLIDLRHRRCNRGHALIDQRRHRRQRLLDGRRQLAFEQLVLLVKQSPGGRDLARGDIKSLLYMLVDVVIQCGVERHERFIKEIWFHPERKRRDRTLNQDSVNG